MKRLLVLTVLGVLTLTTAAPLRAADTHLAHMVFFTLAEDTPKNNEALVAACHKYLSDHEGTVYFSVGTINKDLARGVNDKDFDVALHLVFASREDYDTYATHPRHLKFIEEKSKLWSAVRVFDSNVTKPSGSGE